MHHRPRVLATAIIPVVAAAALLASVAGIAPAAASPKDAPSVCRGTAAFDTTELQGEGHGPLRITMNHNCAAQRVHIVAIVNATTGITGGEAQAAFIGTEVRRAAIALNLGSLSGRENIRVALIDVTDGGAEMVLDFTNDITRIISYEVRGHDSGAGCMPCALRAANDALGAARGQVAPDRPAEFVAVFGYLADDESAEDAIAREMAQQANAMHEDGVAFIGTNRRLASSNAYWINGRNSATVIFRNIGVNHHRTDLADLTLTLDPGGLTILPDTDRPPAVRDGHRLVWAFDWPPLDGVALSLEAVAPIGAPVTLTLHTHMVDARRHERDLAFTHVLGAIEPPPTRTPLPGATSATPTPPPPTRTPGPTPTLPGPRPVAPAFLPMVSRAPCAVSKRRLDVLLVLDTSNSMRGAGYDFVTDAARGASALVATLRSPSDNLRAGERRLGIVRFDREAVTVLPLTGDWRAVAAALRDVLAAEPGCCTSIDAGLEAALDEHERNGRSDHARAIVLLTDGTVNRHYFDAAVDVAFRVQRSGIQIYCVGLGTRFDARLLEGIAGSVDRYHASEDGRHLASLFARIGDDMRCGP